MLMHVLMNILNNINLVDVAHDSVDRKDFEANKHFDILLRIIHSICRIKLKLVMLHIFIFPIKYIYSVGLCSILPFII